MKKMIVIESFAKFASILVMFVVALGCGSCNNIRSNFSSKEATRVEEIVRAYKAVWHAFYDEENLSKMLVVEEVPDDSVGGVRFCFYFDQLAHRLYEGIRLSLNETAYTEWKDKSEKLLDSVGASVYVVDSLDERCRIVCGKAYRFPLEIETRLSEFDRNIDENWLERFVVKVTFLDKEGAAVSSVAVPDFKFYMRSQGRFSLPFSHLSKTRDEISLSRGCVNDSCEMAFAIVLDIDNRCMV